MATSEATINATRIIQDLREMVNDWPRETADVITELFGFDDIAVLQMLIKSTRLLVGDKPHPRITGIHVCGVCGADCGCNGRDSEHCKHAVRGCQP